MPHNYVENSKSTHGYFIRFTYIDRCLESDSKCKSVKHFFSTFIARSVFREIHNNIIATWLALTICLCWNICLSSVIYIILWTFFFVFDKIRENIIIYVWSRYTYKNNLCNIIIYLFSECKIYLHCINCM